MSFIFYRYSLLNIPLGSVVLPILGAVPDGCIVLFSGLGPNAAEELAVGNYSSANMYTHVHLGIETVDV